MKNILLVSEFTYCDSILLIYFNEVVVTDYPSDQILSNCTSQKVTVICFISWDFFFSDISKW